MQCRYTDKCVYSVNSHYMYFEKCNAQLASFVAKSSLGIETFTRERDIAFPKLENTIKP